MGKRTLEMDVEQSHDSMLLDEGMREAELLLQSIICTKRRMSSAQVVDCVVKPRAAKRRWSFRRAKLVRFAETNNVRFIDTQDEEVCQTRWYQKDEYKRIKDENHNTLKAISRACGRITDIDANEHCTRGLELQIRVLLLQLPHDNRQKKVVKSVLSMQQTQRKLRQTDGTALREMSLIISKPDKLKAWRTALIDSQK